MEKLKQVSMKIEESTLHLADKETERSKYYKRNAILNGILTAVLHNADTETLFILYRWCIHGDKKLRITVDEYIPGKD